MTNPNALPAGSVLSSGAYQYRVVKVLGSGGFGITYLVTSARKIGNITVTVHFAIKEHFLSEYCERDSDTLRIITGLGKQRETVDNSMKDFLGEARRLQRVGNGHPSIVKVNEVFEANGTAYYVMEYLEGKSLRAYAEEHGPLAEADALQLLAPVASAVDFLHSCRLTHLDIKPDNIIISEEENADGTSSLRPVLIDFGLSKHYDEEGNATSTINILGCSDGYAPIEQYAGITKFSPEADIYSLAATLLFCLTGSNPKKSTELIYVNMQDYLDGAVPGISPELKDLLLKALSPVPSNRPESLSGLLPAGTEPPRIKAAPTPPATSHVADTAETTLVDAPSRKRPIIYLAIIGVLLVVALGLIFLTRGSGSNEELLAAAESDSVESIVDTIAVPVAAESPSKSTDESKDAVVAHKEEPSTAVISETTSAKETHRPVEEAKNYPEISLNTYNEPLATIYYPIESYTLTRGDRNVIRAVAAVIKEDYGANTFNIIGWYTKHSDRDIAFRRALEMCNELHRCGVKPYQTEPYISNNGTYERCVSIIKR